MKKCFIILALIFAMVFSASAGEKLQIFTEEFVPFNYLVDQGKGTKITGFCYDIVREIQQRIRDKSPIVMSDWSTAYQKVLTTPNTAIFTIGRNPIRDKQFKFVGPLADNGYVFFVKKDSKIELKELEDAKPYRIGVYKDDAAEQFLRIQGFNNLMVAQNDKESINRLLDGTIDMWICPELKAYEAVARVGEKSDSIRGIFVAFNSSLYMAFNKEADDKIIEKWQSTLEAMKKDGAFDKIRQQWVEKIKKGIKTTTTR